MEPRDTTLQARLLCISANEEFRSAIRAVFAQAPSAWNVHSFVAPDRIAGSEAADVILFDDSCLDERPAIREELLLGAEGVVSSTLAPVVLFCAGEHLSHFSSWLSSGISSLVVASGSAREDAEACLEKCERAMRRLRSLREKSGGNSREEETFGEILRHELNNPLTGILGNAELLLAEVRRDDAVHLSAAGLKRLETIAALAVRMRETVRRLSESCDPGSLRPS
ncbi:MAG TPA: histidine kinase dimerization/phospho-acceptor domain-containing protein [Dongiaceae bacterium]|nr:histidine kinase dimerization/phospho-acceptor domain-containing protein [Dongiaceae bacterium]